jgi:hypothetical protein
VLTTLDEIFSAGITKILPLCKNVGPRGISKPYDGNWLLKQHISLPISVQKYLNFAVKKNKIYEKISPFSALFLSFFL